jgi:hypothetical protein
MSTKAPAKIKVKAHTRTPPAPKPKAPLTPAAAFAMPPGMPMPGQVPEQTPGYRGGGQVDPLVNPTMRDTSHDDVAWRNTPGATSLEQYQAQQVQREAQNFNAGLRNSAGVNFTTSQAQDRANQYAGIQADAQALSARPPAAQAAPAKPAVDPAQNQDAAAAGDLQGQPAAALPLTAPKAPKPPGLPTTFGIGLDTGSPLPGRTGSGGDWTAPATMPGIAVPGIADLNVGAASFGQEPMRQDQLFGRGGPVRGPAGPDVIPAQLTRGEYVLPEPTAAAMGGPPALDAAVRATTGKEPGPRPVPVKKLPRGNPRRPQQVGRHPAAAFERGGRTDPLVPIAMAGAPAAVLAAQPYAAAAGRALAYPYTENQVVNRVPKPNASALMDGRQPASPSSVTHASRAMAPAELDAIRRTGFATPPPGGSPFSPEGKWWSAADEQGRFGRAWKAGADAQTVRAPIDAVSANRAVPARALQVLSPAGEWGPVGANRGAAGMTMAKTALGRVGSAAGRAAAVVGGPLATGVGLALTPSNRIATDDQEQAQMPGGRYPAAAFGQGGAVERAAQALTNRTQMIDQAVDQAERGTAPGYRAPPAPGSAIAPGAPAPVPALAPPPGNRYAAVAADPQMSNDEWFKAKFGYAGGGAVLSIEEQLARQRMIAEGKSQATDVMPGGGPVDARGGAFNVPTKLLDLASPSPVYSASPPAPPTEHWWTPKPIGNALYDRKQAAKDQAADRGNAYGGTGLPPVLAPVAEAVAAAPQAVATAAGNAIAATPMVQQDRAMQARIEAQNRENLGPGNPFVGLGRQRPAQPTKEQQAALDVRPDAPKPAAAFGQPPAIATQEASLAAEDAYQRQIEAAGGRRLAGGGWEMPANAPVTAQGLVRQVAANGAPALTAEQAFSPERVAAARADAQAHPNKPDSYGGYDVSQMGPAEYGALQAQMGAEAQDLAGARAFYAMPPGERGPAPASVQRAMAPGVSPSAAFGMKAEERSRAAGAETQKLQADLLGKQITAGGADAKDSGIAKRAENKQFTSTFDSLTKGVSGGEPRVEGEHRDAAISTLGALEAAGYGLDVDAKTKAAMAAGYARTRSKIMAQAQAEALKQGLVGPAADAYLADAAKRADVQARAQFRSLMGG